MASKARQAAFDALMRVEGSGAYSNITLNNILKSNKISGKDKAFTAMLLYGVLEKKLLLDYNLSRLSDRPVNKLDIGVLTILRMGLYQIYFTNTPESAAVNESVELCKVNKLNSASGYVNAVLRAGAGIKEPYLPEKKRGKTKYLSIRYSCPEPIVRLWRESYGDELTQELLLSLEGRPPITARVNTLRITAAELAEELLQKGIKASQCTVPEDCLELSAAGAVEELEAYKNGLLHIQDRASQLCCRVLAPQSGDVVIDACSAPGGKSFTMAELMNNEGTIISCDLYEHRLRLVESGAQRLGIGIIKTMVGDASGLTGLPAADRVLCDVPCSGLGIIRRKPELRYKEDTGAESLPELQYSILCRGASFLKSGGVLVYSTCTLNPAENGSNIRRFLNEHEDFEPVPIDIPEGIDRAIDEPENELTLFPCRGGTDGFFISKIRRK